MPVVKIFHALAIILLNGVHAVQGPFALCMLTFPETNHVAHGAHVAPELDTFGRFRHARARQLLCSEHRAFDAALKKIAQCNYIHKVS